MLPNRVMTSAMTMQYGEDGLISDRHLALYEERARGGVGLMFSEQLWATKLYGLWDAGPAARPGRGTPRGRSPGHLPDRRRAVRAFDDGEVEAFDRARGSREAWT